MSDLAASISGLSNNFSGRLLLPKDSEWDAARRVHNGLVDKRPAVDRAVPGELRTSP